MLKELTLDGVMDKVEIAIDRLKSFEPEEGYYLCFSGGKDSQCIYHLAIMAGVKFEAYYNITGIDPPELVYFIRKNYPDVIFNKYKKSMFELIEEKGLPTRLRRFCCSELKEKGGEGRFCVTGVRWAESPKRKSRKPFEIVTSKKEDRKLFNDNLEDRRLFENCMQKGKKVINPIIDWTDNDVWEFLNSNNIEHCILYDEGAKRIGCILCPMASLKSKEYYIKKYPKFYNAYKRAAQKYFKKYIERCEQKGTTPSAKNIEEFMAWWIYSPNKKEYIEGQMEMNSTLNEYEY
jgi:phosphoadenosine phosphosulfate reductase